MNIDRLWALMGLRRIHRPGRYTALLISILALLIFQSFLTGHIFAQFIVTVFMSFVLLAALYTFESSRTFFVIALIVMVPSFASRWMLQFYPSRPEEILAAASTSTFLMMTVVGLVVELFSVKRVTLDTISAAICAYLLMALAWAFIYVLIAIQHPGSFSAGLMIPAPGPGSHSKMSEEMRNFVYYSFVCITTTGFGDIAPLSQSARLFSVLESVIGQLYLAILIARLVSLEVAQSMMGGREQ